MAVKTFLTHTTALDRILVLIALCMAAAGCIGVARGERGQRVIVEQDGKVLYRAPLDEDRTVSLAGPLGETVLRIQHGEARVLSSPCPNHTCMGMGGAKRRGDLLACVPNHLLVRIVGEGKEREERPYELLSR